MRQLIVVSRPDDWPLEIDGVERISARDYLTDPLWLERRATRVYNLCRSYSYHSNGYYVSLLAAARGHKPLPSVSTLLDFRAPNVVRLTTSDLTRLIEQSLRPLQSEQFTLSIYFGRNLAKRYDRLARALFNLFPAPLLQARFQRGRDGWLIRRISPIGFSDIPDSHLEFVSQAAERFFSGQGPRLASRKTNQSRFDLAMLANPKEENPPSNARALALFRQAGETAGFHVELIGPDEIGRLAEFDALFIRETTAVNHHTYRFARRAVAEGLTVIDDPDSILKCTNKVYLAELLQRHGVPTPKTLLVHRDNVSDIVATLGLPVVLKQPDSAFSMGVKRVESAGELDEMVQELQAGSDMIVAQEYIPTPFDWRVGVLDGRALYVCRYHMARGHWQIIHRQAGRVREGMADTLATNDAPGAVVEMALKSAGLIGNGLYGVDLKEVEGRVLVIEVNDNPSIDAGCEDAVLKKSLYREIMGVFLNRVTASKLGG